MRRTTIFLEPGVDQDLQALARRDKRPMAAVVREALAQYVAGRQHRGLKLPTFTGVGASGRTDVAERHEEWLWRDLAPHKDAVQSERRRRQPARRAARVRAAKAGSRPPAAR